MTEFPRFEATFPHLHVDVSTPICFQIPLDFFIRGLDSLLPLHDSLFQPLLSLLSLFLDDPIDKN